MTSSSKQSRVSNEKLYGIVSRFPEGSFEYEKSLFNLDISPSTYDGVLNALSNSEGLEGFEVETSYDGGQLYLNADAVYENRATDKIIQEGLEGVIPFRTREEAEEIIEELEPADERSASQL